MRTVHILTKAQPIAWCSALTGHCKWAAHRKGKKKVEVILNNEGQAAGL